MIQILATKNSTTEKALENGVRKKELSIAAQYSSLPLPALCREPGRGSFHRSRGGRAVAPLAHVRSATRDLLDSGSPGPVRIDTVVALDEVPGPSGLFH